MSQFLGKLSATLVDDFKGLWSLNDPLPYMSDVLGGKIVTAPAGFVTDFASGPYIGLVSVARDNGRLPAVIHDLLYTTEAYPRDVCDAVLREAMRVVGYSAVTANAYWLAVRSLGWWHWRKPNQPQTDSVQSAMAQVGA